jgi:hypothetical protein
VIYRVVFDAAQKPPDWQPLIGLVFVVLGVLTWRFRDRMPWAWGWPFRTSARWRRAWVVYFLGFAVLWTTVATWAVLGRYVEARRALAGGRTAIVEGVVEDFHPMPPAGHDTEWFRVGGVRFAYSDGILSAGFNQTAAHGGPIREGLRVRIHYTGSPASATILRLEVAD